jgi:hypothetical protein
MVTTAATGKQGVVPIHPVDQLVLEPDGGNFLMF